VKTFLGLGIFGPLMILLGAYVAGGTTVVCTRVNAVAESTEPKPEVVGLCRVETTRWLGRSIIEERTYPHITAVSRIATTSRSSSNSKSTTSWSLQLMSLQAEAERIGAARDQVDASFDAAQAWFGGEAGNPLRLDLTDYRFAYTAMGFGVLWLFASGLIAKHSGGGYPASDETWAHRVRRRHRKKKVASTGTMSE
jgi:hypothetical protein